MGRGAAIVIGGAVAKGAFAAGALAVLTEKLTAKGTPIRRLVGTSSGALNATMLAAGVRAGDPVGAAQKLTHLREEKANVWGIIEPDLLSWLHGRGLSGTRRIIGLLKAECPTAVASPPVPVSLRIVVTPLAGVDKKGRLRSVDRPRTSFEHVERFEGADLDDKEKRERIFQAAAASAAFPFAFEPVALQDVGPCVDGGVVNNTPIGEAIDQDPEIDIVYVIAADPAHTDGGDAEPIQLLHVEDVLHEGSPEAVEGPHDDDREPPSASPFHHRLERGPLPGSGRRVQGDVRRQGHLRPQPPAVARWNTPG
jgi:predicted acylesterase/phospholipase RssA